MPEIIPNHVPSPRTLLAWDGTAYRPVTIDAAGHVQIDVLTSGLPLGAATAANQALILAQVQAIEDLTHALQSVATDRLQVRGEDQLFSYAEPLVVRTQGNPTGIYHVMASAAVPAGQVWVVTTIASADYTTALTSMDFTKTHGVIGIGLWQSIRAFAIAELGFWGGHIYMEEGDVVTVSYGGGLNTDTCIIFLNGYIMTKE